MKFTPDERVTLLAVKGVGPKVIERLEQMGFSNLIQLAEADANDILAQGASLSGSSCWKNSPQAKSAVQSAIGAALATVHSDSSRLKRMGSRTLHESSRLDNPHIPADCQ